MTILCPHCHTELPASSRFCMNCGIPIGTDPRESHANHAHPAAPIPAPLADKVRAAAHLIGERRTVTAVYVDVVRSSFILAAIGEQAYNNLLDAMLDLVYPIVYHYEGTIAHIQDDELLVFFGAPVAHEDDPVRAVRTALELLQAVRHFSQEASTQYGLAAHGLELAVRISLSTGPVSIGPIGADLKYAYSALGGTVNLAAQLEATKVPMSVLISKDTHRFIAPFFDCTDLGDVTIPGMSEPVHIYRVDQERPTPGSSRGLGGLQSPMVGRKAEMKALLQLSQLLQIGLGRAALIIGEPGLGKTRLVSEWKKAVSARAELQPIRWIEGRCLSYGQGLPYHLIISLVYSLLNLPPTASEPETHQALHSLLAGLFKESQSVPDEADLMDVYPYIGHLLSLRLDGEAAERTRLLDPQALQNQVQAALRHLLRMLALRQPLTIVLEDLHWADATSSDLLAGLIDLVTTERILICLVMRPERGIPGWGLVQAVRQELGNRLTEFSIDALTEAESQQLVSYLLEIEALPEQIRQMILRKAEGNPFFVEEVIRMLIERGAIIQQGGRWTTGEPIEEIDIPDNLQGLLMARIDRLPDEVKHTLRVAAVIGRQFPVKVLEYVLAREAAV
jgi:class 3 adenylate cyclase